jgi:cell division protein FtsZ
VQLAEVNEAMTLILNAADVEAEIIFGAVIDPSLNDEIRITVIATDFAATAASSQPAPPLRGPHSPGPGNRPPAAPDNDLAIPAFMRKSAN